MISHVLWFVVGALAGAAVGLAFFCESLAKRQIATKLGSLLSSVGVKDPRVSQAIGDLLQ